MTKWLRRLRFWFNRRRLGGDLAAEMESHRAMHQDQLERSGMGAAEAAVASRRAMGNMTLAAEDARDEWIGAGIERVWKDIRYGMRTLWRQRTVTLTALLTLGVGIGATTTVFSIVEAAIWRPLPFPEADRLAAVFSSPRERRAYSRATVAEYVEWQAQSGEFDELAAWGLVDRRILQGRGSPELLEVLPVTTNFFDTLRQPPALGRGFTAEDASGRTVAILSDACWRRLFSSDPATIGSIVTIDDRNFTIVGITGAEERLEVTPLPDVFVLMDLAARTSAERTRRHLRVFGRLAPGAGIDGARAQLELVSARVSAGRLPGEILGSAHVEDLRQAYTGGYQRSLYFFLGAVMFVLLLTCANVASLLLSRAI